MLENTNPLLAMTILDIVEGTIKRTIKPDILMTF